MTYLYGSALLTIDHVNGRQFIKLGHQVVSMFDDWLYLGVGWAIYLGWSLPDINRHVNES